MSRKKNAKQCWEMTPEELRDATKEFDEDFVFERTKAMTPETKERWERAKAKGASDKNGQSETTITVRLDKDLLARSAALAKKKRLTQDALVARGLRVLLAVEDV